MAGPGPPLVDLGPWPATCREAAALQQAWRQRVVLRPLGRPPRLIAGVDAAYEGPRGRVFGAAALFSYPELELLEEVGAAMDCPFPYIPGLLSFREIPVLLEALRRLSRLPDLILADGQGIAHPRGLGLASHLGVLLHLPVIGVAKSRLAGEGEEPDREAGAWRPLFLQGRIVGLILRTQTGRRPLYVSPGHLVVLQDCREIVMGCVRRYRVPEPLRAADRLSRRLRKAACPSLPG